LREKRGGGDEEAGGASRIGNLAGTRTCVPLASW